MTYARGACGGCQCHLDGISCGIALRALIMYDTTVSILYIEAGAVHSCIWVPAD